MNGCQPCNGNLDKTVWLNEHTADCQVPMLTSITFMQLQHVIWFCKFTVVSHCSGPRIYCWLKGVYLLGDSILRAAYRKCGWGRAVTYYKWLTSTLTCTWFLQDLRIKSSTLSTVWAKLWPNNIIVIFIYFLMWLFDYRTFK